MHGYWLDLLTTCTRPLFGAKKKKKLLSVLTKNEKERTVIFVFGLVAYASLRVFLSDANLIGGEYCNKSRNMMFIYHPQKNMA